MNTMTITNENQDAIPTPQYPAVIEAVEIITRKEFCLIWKKISNDRRIKPTLVEHKSYSGDNYQVKEKGWIYPEHHIIHNLIRGLPPTRGFKEGTEGYENALNFLRTTSNFGYAGNILKPFEESMSSDKFKVLLFEIKALLK